MGSIPEIKDRLKAFSQEGLSVTGLKDDVFRHCQNYIIKKLNESLSLRENESQKLARLKRTLERVSSSMHFYTIYPQHPLISLLLEIAEFIASHEPDSSLNLTQKTLKILMPELIVTPEIELPELDNSWQQSSAQEVLRTHILSEDRRCLLPLALLGRVNFLEMGPIEIVNPYFDVDKDASSRAFLTDDEIKRLFQHSELTAELWQAKLNYNYHVRSENSLLSSINQLCEELRVVSLDGDGSEDNARIGADESINLFLSYYDQLATLDKEAIPFNIKNEVRLLRHCIYKAEAGSKPIPRSEHCLAKRRLDLLSAVEGHEASLGRLSLSQSLMINQTTYALERLKSAIDAFTRHYFIDKDVHCFYEVGERHTLSAKLFRSLGINIKFSDSEDLKNALINLTPAEIENLLLLQGFERKVVGTLETWPNSIHIFSDLIQSFSAKQFAALSSRFSKVMSQRIVSMEELLCLLESIQDNERFLVFCELIKRDPLRFLSDPETRDQIHMALPPSRQLIWQEVFSDEPCLKEEEIRLESAESHMPFETLEELCLLFQSASAEERAPIIPTFTAQVVPVLSSFDELLNVFNCLNETELSAFCRILSNSPKAFLTESMTELATFMNKISLNQARILIESHYPRFYQAFRYNNDFMILQRILHLAKRFMVLSLFDRHLSDLIKTAANSRVMLALVLDFNNESESNLFQEVQRKWFWPRSCYIELIQLVRVLKEEGRLLSEYDNEQSSLRQLLESNAELCCWSSLFMNTGRTSPAAVGPEEQALQMSMSSHNPTHQNQAPGNASMLR